MPASDSFASFPMLQRLRAALPGLEIYLVGGAVRDGLLGRVSHDLDFAVAGGAIRVARRVASMLDADFYALDESFDIGRVIVAAEGGGRDILDFSAFRGPDLNSDLLGRDFTINAIAYDLQNEVVLDPLKGASDLRAKRIRACSPTSLQDDPIRILRAVRQAASLEFGIENATRLAMKAAVSLLPQVSAERQRDELFKTLEGPRCGASLRALEMLGVFPFLLPELAALKGVEQSPPHVADVWEHTLSVLSHLEDILAALAPAYDAGRPNDLFTGLLTERLGRFREQFEAHLGKRLNSDRSLRALLFFAALYHDVSKPATRTVEETGRVRFLEHDRLGAEVAADRGRAFNLSRAEIERLEVLLANHMRFHGFSSRLEGEKHGPSRQAIYRFFRDSGEGGIDLVLLGLADLRGTRGHTLTQETWAAALDVARLLLENYWEKPEETIAPLRLINGVDVMHEYELEQGPLVGHLLEAIREAQATGKVSSRAEALAFGRQWLKENQA